MIITRHGKYFIKLQSGDTTIAINPVSKDSKEKSQKFGADLALISLNHPDFNGKEEVIFGSKNPFIIEGPGEYESQEIFVKGFLTKSNYTGKESLNTCYTILFESMKIGILGAITLGDFEKENKDVINSMEDVDIIFVPVSKETLDSGEAYKLASLLNPKIIIPLGDDSLFRQVAKEAGTRNPQTSDKITLRKKDFDGKDGEVMILTY